LKVTSQAAADLTRGRTDPVFFAERWLGIELHPGQIEWIQGMAARDESGWRPKYLTTVCSAGNRAGKTLGMAVAVFHSAFYKLGVKPTDGTAQDAMRWQNSPYEWYHVGIQQETAELVHREISMILEGGHPAQRGRGCPLISEMGRVIDHTKKYRGEYLWIQFHPLVGGANIHFRTTQEKAKALLGKDMNGISFDEAAFEPHLMQIYQEVLNLRRLSTGGQLHFIGTPTEGINDYADLWEMGNTANQDRDPQVFSFRLSTRGNVGFGLAADTFDAILRQQTEYLIPQNIDGFFIEASNAYFSSISVDSCFVDSLPSEQPPAAKRKYVQGCDPGLLSDSTWAITLDNTVKDAIIGVRARTRTGKQTIQAVVNMVREGHLLYNQDSNCTTILDETGFGGKMFKQEFSIIKPLRGYDFGGTKAKKLELLSDLKATMDKKMISFPRTGIWMQLRRQLLAYKLDDKKLEQDAVMALAVAVRHALRNQHTYVENPVFTYFGGSD
jgi:hypothetical protein